MSFVIIAPLYPPTRREKCFLYIFAFRRATLGAAGLCKRLGGLVSKIGQTAEKFFEKIFPVSALRPLKAVSYFCCFGKRSKSSFCQGPGSNFFLLILLRKRPAAKKNLAPILEIGANRLEGIFCYLLFKKTGVH